MTEYERATLRLEAWKALYGWGVPEPAADGEPETLKRYPLVTPWDWETRKLRANELYEWLLEKQS